jgi:hypothetical protein
MIDELNAIMKGELSCDDMNLSAYINYCKNKIESMMPFIKEVEEKNIVIPYILEVRDIFVKKIYQYQVFLDWCKIERVINV